MIYIVIMITIITITLNNIIIMITIITITLNNIIIINIIVFLHLCRRRVCARRTVRVRALCVLPQ